MIKARHDTEDHADAVARYHRQSHSGGDLFALVVMPDGSGFHCVPAGESMDAERLNREQMIEKLIELFGASVFRTN